MAENKKSIIEQALLDIELMKEGLKSNAEDIFRSVAKDEVRNSLKENITEEFDEEDVEDETENDDTEDTEVAGDEPGMDDTEDTASDDLATVDAEDSVEDYGDEEGSEDYMDMTGASDDDVISVFKKMDANDGVDVVSDKEIHITTPDGGEYQIKLGGSTEMDGLDMGADMDDMGAEMGDDMGAEMGGLDMGAEEEDEDEGIMFEVEMDEEDVIEEDIVRGPGHDKKDAAGGGSLPSGNIEGQKATKDPESGDNLGGGFDDDAVKYAHAEGPMVMSENDEIVEEEVEETIEEQIPVGSAQDKRVPATNAKNAEIVGAGSDGAKLAEAEAKYKKLLAEAKKLEAENNEFKNALIEFRKSLGETALFTKNLSHVTKLFLEHSTTSDEKQEIMKRFDSVKSIKESIELKKVIDNELTSKKPLKESFEDKINNNKSTSNSTVLKENAIYMDPSIKRMLDLMNKK